MKFVAEDSRIALYDDKGQEAGEMVWMLRGDTMIIVHTHVEARFQGQGLAQELVKQGVQVAREKGLMILPLCPYAKSQFDKKAEYSDVLSGDGMFGWE
ncbi:MAG: N-acetyltransferase [Streptococcaceae bacterium]|jgi:predicted GNAT family acetyltransferase|nr:N-acetyltransferase [Streptococcaceae bacterium]